jgi:glycerol-3-phosphate dehydrogenase (NAD(P)+)
VNGFTYNQRENPVARCFEPEVFKRGVKGMQVGMIGLGNMGSAVGNLIAGNGRDVLGWEFNPEVVREINEQQTNSVYLPGITLKPGLKATEDVSQVISNSQVLFIAIPSAFVESTLRSVRDGLPRETIIVNMTKGIDRHTGLTSHQTLSALFPDNRKLMLSGPSIANEFARGMPTIVVLAGDDGQSLMAVAKMLDNDCFRTRFSDDVIGVELGGVLKNIYSIGLGIFDGKGINSVNFRSVYLTIALEEIAKMGVAMGAKIETFLYLSGIGDLLATSLSEHSHNRALGESLAGGKSLAEIKREMGVLPEGFNTLRIVLYIAEKLHVSIPLAKGLWDVLHGRYEADKFITSFIRDFVEW